ncbi:MAG: FapA family protein, partial [Pseudomonadales bacterium]|nr:FapA family protein [Pseudomonadales bacterium]
MRKEPATTGTPGKDVTGAEIKPVPGKDPGFAKNIQGAELSPQDPNVLIATIKGHPIFMKNGVCVDPVLHVDNVDINTGNIEFDGSLEVRGDVAAGMQINVTGDVIVKGVIERSLVYAGNDIVVRGGVFGDDDAEDIPETVNHQQKYLLYARGSIDASFVSTAAIKADGDIIVKQYIGNSLVIAGNSLSLGQQGGKGILFGGLAKVRYLAALVQLGNESNLETRLIVGEYDQLMQQLVTIKKTLVTRQKEADQLQVILDKVGQQKNVKLGKVVLDKTQRISNTIKAIREKVAELKAKMSEINAVLPQHKAAHVVIGKKIYPNASLTINGASTTFREEQRADTWRASGDKLIRDSEKE